MSIDLEPNVLMVSTEYPPIPGGVGRYTRNLVTGLRGIGVNVNVLCNEKGEGNFFGLDPLNDNNSKVILNTIAESNCNIVHIQLEHGLYGLRQIYSHKLKKFVTNIDEFYEKCQIPIVTTYHSAYPFQQWMKLSKLLYYHDNESSNQSTDPFKKIKEYWMRLKSYYTFNESNRIKMNKSSVNIAFSHYLASLISGNNISGNGSGDDEGDRNLKEKNFTVIYHGAESNLPAPVAKKEARHRFNLPVDKKIGLLFGFATQTKGWDILDNLNIPENWTIVINHSKNFYGSKNPPSIGILDKSSFKTETGTTEDNKIINLDRGFLSDPDLSILLYACDAVILPYTVTSGSGVMFDALGHGLPFISSDLGFFKEFERQGLGITVKRRSHKFNQALTKFESNYSYYAQKVKEFQGQLKWENVARQHLHVYTASLNKAGLTKKKNCKNF